MSFHSFRIPAAGVMVFGLLGLARVAVAKPPVSDINGLEKRRAVVELGTRLTKPASVASLPAELASPFSPPGFELTDAEERVAAAALTGKTLVSRAGNDRDTLEQIAAKIIPTGTMMAGADRSEWRLNFGKSTVKVGTHFTVTFNGRDHDLELVRISNTNFTLRLNREEITRPIKPGKSP